ncbi:NAD(P)/FAD-dependent oxidoreductase [Halorubrum ezzemoulense]|uniref:Protoporphyrinogen oxidase n=1 Tax=Halorubrum ezzemoulense TaxID=337243 RepID=A0A256K4D0_HALEZ|nr:NAD(P)/FAD-dependent oxidoreductase [Halorubrum ezzemoulense]OYR75656.1 protoporphyrinogen oxidase [Halorubrum ezzemoulense]
MQLDTEIAVVGGGIAGLTAAYRLQEHGFDVCVFEASDDLGGLASVYETSGDPIEKFYHHLSKSEETIVELAKELGIGKDIEWKIGKNAYYINGDIHPMDKPWEIFSFPYWNLYDKFRLGMLTLDIDVRGGIPKFDTYEQLSDFEDVPVEEFAREHTTPNVYETFFEPLLDAKFGSRKDDVSAAWLLGRIKFRGERDILRGEILGYLDGGFGRLLDSLINAVGRENIESNTRVTDIQTVDNEVTGLTAEREDETGESVTESHNVDSVVVATMPNVLEDLTGYSCDIDFQGTVCSVISMEESLLETYWLNIADDAPFGALIEHTNFIEKERYGGEHLLYVARYIQSPDEDVWQQTDDEIRETWLSGIESLFPEFDRDSVNWVRTARNPRTAPVYERGYLDMVVPYDLSEEVADGVYYAGMASSAQYPERSLNGGVVAGSEVADRIVEN